jgi:hypothetical protein
VDGGRALARSPRLVVAAGIANGGGGGDRTRVRIASNERVYVLSACSFWLLKKAGKQRRKIVASLSRCPIARSILHGVTAQYETDSSSEFDLPFTVD